MHKNTSMLTYWRDGWCSHSHNCRGNCDICAICPYLWMIFSVPTPTKYKFSRSLRHLDAIDNHPIQDALNIDAIAEPFRKWWRKLHSSATRLCDVYALRLRV